ncbi:MAG: hypothetical protein WC551_08650 [Patescibacteria group bacterium]
MNTKILKYEIPVPKRTNDYSVIGMPNLRQVLAVGTQVTDEERIFVWVAVDADVNAVQYSEAFYVIPTGGTLPDMYEINFVGTVFFKTAPLVFHIYHRD